MKHQKIYIYLDDSGKIVKHEQYAIYAGLLFLDKNESLKFKKKYEAVRNDIWKKQEYQNLEELKGSNLKKKDRIRLLKLIKQQSKVCLIINNYKINKQDILTNADSKGRFRDYAIKRLIRKIFEQLILNKKLNPYMPTTLILSIDQETSKSNGKYSLKDGIYEEIKKGVINFDYGFTKKPLLHSDFNVQTISYNSKENTLIQSADILSNDIRRCLLEERDILSDLTLRLP